MGAVSVRVRDERSPGRAVGELELTLERRTTLRDLIRTRVREEVARYNSSPGERFNGLVRPTDAEEDANGYHLRKPRRLDWEQQARVAEEAFGRNGYFVIVGDRQVDDLDEELELTPETEIRFLRLTPLVGG
jgi:hypothetical protein